MQQEKTVAPLRLKSLQKLLMDAFCDELEITERRILKRRDVCLVELVTFSSQKKASHSVIVKVLFPPLEREAMIYTRFGLGRFGPDLLFTGRFMDQSVLVFDHIEGASIRDNWKKDEIQRVAGRIGRLHCITQDQGLERLPYEEAFPAVLPGCAKESLCKMVQRIEGQWPELAARITSEKINILAERLEGIFQFFRPVLVHGDLFADNIIRAGTELFIIDWDFAFLGPGPFDIYTLSLSHSKNGGRCLPFGLLWKDYAIYAGESIITSPTDAQMKRIHCTLEGLDRLRSINWLVERAGRGLTAIGDLKRWVDEAICAFVKHMDSIDK